MGLYTWKILNANTPGAGCGGRQWICRIDALEPGILAKLAHHRTRWSIRVIRFALSTNLAQGATDFGNALAGKRVSFHFKQWGGVNKKKAGRELEGRTWNEMPAGLDAARP